MKTREQARKEIQRKTKQNVLVAPLTFMLRFCHIGVHGNDPIPSTFPNFRTKIQRPPPILSVRVCLLCLLLFERVRVPLQKKLPPRNATVSGRFVDAMRPRRQLRRGMFTRRRRPTTNRPWKNASEARLRASQQRSRRRSRDSE